MPIPPLTLHALVGTGDATPAQFKTNGRLRWEIDCVSGAFVAYDQTEPTDTIRPQYFFRLSGARWQFCVKFPSGATQILATEP